MNVLVTGGAGFIGSHLVDALIARGDRVRVIDNLFSGKHEYVNPATEFFQADVREFETIRPLFDGVDTVFHLAALVSIPLSVEQPDLSYAYNVVGTKNVLQAGREAWLKKVVFASSCAVYGENGCIMQREDAPLAPQSPYAVHKIEGERLCREILGAESATASVILRFFNVYGSLRQSPVGGYASVMRAFCESTKEGKPLPICGDGMQTRDFVHYRDVVEALLRAADNAALPSGEIFNIGSGVETSVNELADTFGGERKYTSVRNGEVRRVAADIGKAKTLLSWEPCLTLEEGIRNYLAG